jgi:LPXTG-motif cell wall-anchored protein
MSITCWIFAVDRNIIAANNLSLGENAMQWWSWLLIVVLIGLVILFFAVRRKSK